MNRSELPKSLARWADVIDEISDERGSDEGYWVYLKAGWWSPDDETHCIHEDTIRECVVKMRNIEPCTKECCK